ncbi:apolipoprotein L3-like [Ochotona curzoniae]|uniref:apolipoprotein L3-like n=1 Tax=Ochotona curzoniae TaxID=130825 RepID=UPI001B34691F|nr:apolipoprotein L3-like [Ochotona curzoniae]
MASSDEDEQGGNGVMVPDDKRHIADIIAHFQDIVSMEHLQSLLMDADAQEAFLSVAESSRVEANPSCETVQMESKEEDHSAAGGHEEDQQTGYGTMVPDAESRFVDIIEYMKNALSREEQLYLLVEDEAWEIFVCEAELSSEAAHALREALLSYYTDTDTDSFSDQDRYPNTDPNKDSDSETDSEDKEEQQARERFLKEFPQVKAQLEESIAKLHALADKVGKVHRYCTITNVVAASTGAASGILSIAGLALAPVTAGVSLALTATGMGLGAAAGVTGASTAVVEHVTRASAEAEAGRITSSSVNQVELVAKTVGQSVPKILNVTRKCVQALEDVGKNVHAIKVAQNNTRLVRNAKRFMTTGKISARNTRQVQKAFGGTALAMTKGARFTGAATAGLFFLLDVANLVQESKHLQQGAPSESAQDLRKQAQELEEKLAQLMEIYRNLQ